MNRKLTVAVSLLVLIAFSLVGQSLALSNDIGIHTRDNFIYSIHTIWSTNASATVPPYLLEINSTVFVVNVTAVQDPDVNATISWLFSNGTDLNNLITLDVDSGAVVYYVPNMPVFQGFYAANLSLGQVLRSTGNSPSTLVQQTEFGNYSSGLRETNLASITSSLTGGTETKALHIDKATGVLVEFTDYTELPDQRELIIWTLIETNIWTVSSSQNPTPTPSIPEFPQTLILPVVAAMFLTITLSLAVYSRSRHHSLVNQQSIKDTLESTS